MMMTVMVMGMMITVMTVMVMGMVITVMTVMGTTTITITMDDDGFEKGDDDVKEKKIDDYES